MTITHKIKMDLVRRGIIPRLQAVQGDALTRQVEIRLLADGQPWQIPGTPTVLIRYRRPDRATGEYDTLADGTPAGSTEGTAVTITLAREVLAVPGDVVLVVTLVLGGRELSTFEFLIAVQPNHSRGIFSGPDQASVTGMLPAPEVARPGQILVIEEVDEYGLIRRMKADNALPGTTITQIVLDESQSDEVASRYLITMNDGSIHEFTVNHGKSAYAYAREAGYRGTEAQFAQQLVRDTSLIHVGAEAPEDAEACLWIDTEEVANANARPDWNAAEGEVGHIENRTHYMTRENILPETTMELTNGIGAIMDGPALICGEEYIVRWNGTEYHTKCTTLMGASCIGNAALTGYGADSGEPFAIAYSDGTMVVMTDTAAPTLTIDRAVYRTLSEGYLPANVRSYTVVVPEGEANFETPLWTLSESLDRAAQVLYYGGDVWIDYSVFTTDSVGLCVKRAKVYAYELVVEQGELKLACFIRISGRDICIMFGNGTWMPPEA